jgi:hypothetical protein
MSVPRKTSAREELRALLSPGVAANPGGLPEAAWQMTLPWGDAEFGDELVTPVPEAAAPTNWLWSQPCQLEQMGLRDPEAYALAGAPDCIHEPRAVALDGSGVFDKQQQQYCRMSVDVTMRGGTTSGVVYPNAVCEIARGFRLRNVGGASAGAIAAATAAAAERGRCLEAAGVTTWVARTPEELADGQVGLGFAGLGDATSWFSELDRPDNGRCQFRVAQLFRPTLAALPFFRLASASMQKHGKVARFVTLAALSSGALRFLTFLLLLLAPAFTAWLWLDASHEPIRFGHRARWHATAYVASAVELVAVTIAISAVLCLIAFARSGDPVPDVHDDVAEPVLRLRPAGKSWPTLVLAIVCFLVAGAFVWVAWLPAHDSWARSLAKADYMTVTGSGWNLLLMWVAFTGLQAALHVWGLMRVALTAKEAKFGMIAGATDDGVTRGQHRLLNKVAGMPHTTVTEPLIPWLSHTLGDLAGLEGPISSNKVLRFGHLWSPTSYDAPPPRPQRTPEVTPDPRPLPDLAIVEPEMRSINLELMTSELVHGVPYRFPLRADEVRGADGHPRLYLRESDMVEVFPLEVVEALTAFDRDFDTARSIETGDSLPVADLFPLPNPEDLPVIFATRLSLSFPALFQAVRLYSVVGRASEPHLIRDEYGARLHRNGLDLSYPGPTTSKLGSEKDVWLEELWFTDGGVTSNFPVHFFDNPVPLWPTLGINLGGHPAGFAHQDVWLPADDQSRTSPSSPLGNGFPSFIGSLFNTARGWHDIYQTFMPAYRGRVAWVRQRPDEGGNNLYMERETIASLALRGAIAGRRLRRRFEKEEYWHRHQWLRLRIAARNLADLRQGVGTASRDAKYAQLFAADTLVDGDTLIDAMKAALGPLGDPTPPTAADPPGPDGASEWFAPTADAYWTYLAALMAAVADHDGAEAGEGIPTPSPDLKQVPPV